MKLSRKKSIKSLVLVAIPFFVIIAGLVFNTLKTNSDSVSSPLVFSVTEDDRYEIRATSSPYTIIEFMDLNCVYCKGLHEQREKFHDRIQNVNLIVRNYPLLDSGRSAYKVLIGECVAEQAGNEGWFNYIDLSYDAFERRFENAYFEKLGKDIVNDDFQFDNCLKNPLLMDKITKQRTDNQVNQVTYVPTFVLLKDGVFVKKYDGISAKLALEMLRYYSGLNNDGIPR